MSPEELKPLENDLWRSADTLRANSDLKSSEYSTPVLGLIFLKFADNRYRRFEKEILKEYARLKGTRCKKALSDVAIENCGFYLPDHARYDYLLNLPDEKDAAKAIRKAMEAIEEYKPELRGILPKDEYARLIRTDKTIPAQLLKNFSSIPRNAEGDIFGQIYEYFLGNFAMAESQGGGEFFTPRSVVRIMVAIIKPFGGAVFDPACGSTSFWGGEIPWVSSAQMTQHRIWDTEFHVTKEGANSVTSQFESLVRPLFDQIEILSKANTALSTTGNMLLPRLISGKLSVENLDIQFPPSMREAL